MCEYCEDSRRRGFRFCHRCGEYLGEPGGYYRKGKEIDIVMKIGLLITLICSVLLLMSIRCFLQIRVRFENLGNATNSMVILLPYPVTFTKISGIVLQFYYVLLLISVLASLILVFWKAYGPFMTMVREKDTKPMKNTALFELSVLFAVIYAISIAFVVILAASGTVVEDPFKDEELWVEMFAYLEASVWEEVISRILLIGVPMFILCVVLKGRTGTLCEPLDDKWASDDVVGGNVTDSAYSSLSDADGNAVEKKEYRWWNYLLGGTGLNYAAIILIVFSSLIFGLAHIPLWGVWKSFQTFIMGLIFGYIFAKYGVYATIALHFLADYLQSIEWISEPLIIIPGLAVFALIGLGLVYIWVYGERLIRFVQRIRKDLQ
jgi:CAAX amino terminal protease family.